MTPPPRRAAAAPPPRAQSSSFNVAEMKPGEWWIFGTIEYPHHLGPFDSLWEAASVLASLDTSHR